MRKILVVYGTRPEAIKMAPLITELERSAHCTPVVVVTGQHRTMLDQVNGLFGIRPAHDLDIISTRQQLADITCRVLHGVIDVIDVERPDAVLVQGDTTSCFAASLAAFYRQTPVIHLEAGLRTRERYDPFPEEMNRRLTTQMADVHLAPTRESKRNLLQDGIAERDIVVTGNTVIDALMTIADRDMPAENLDLDRVANRRSVLITAHRRESWGEPMARTARAIARLAELFPDVAFLLPAHLNPVVRDVLLPPLAGLANVIVTAPLDYADFVRAMRNCSIVLTDSGGVQEEAPTFGKPVLVLRETTERPEAVAAGTVRLIGTEEARIVLEVASLLTDHAAYLAMSRAVNPYGDGKAAERSVRAIEHYFGIGSAAVEFTPAVWMMNATSAPGSAGIVNDFAA